MTEIWIGFFLALAIILLFQSPDLVADLILWIQRVLGLPRNVKTGREGLIGKTCEALSDFCGPEGSGTVRAHGEIWSATLRAPADSTEITAGMRLRVVAVHDLTLHVEPIRLEASAKNGQK